MRMNVPILSTLEKAAVDGLRKAGREVLQRSNELAPKDDGDLVKSGKVRVDDMTVQVAYTAVHARFQHERLDWKHTGGGQSKFLETAAAEVDVAKVVAESVGKALDG